MHTFTSLANMGKPISEDIITQIEANPALYQYEGQRGRKYLLKHKVIAHFRCSWGTAYKIEAILNEKWNEKALNPNPATA
jgi:hypothetical protein